MTTPAIRLQDVSVSYGRTSVLRNLSLEVQAGEILALVGPNGGGKSTLLRVIAGIIRPQGGSVIVSGKCGYVAQSFALYRDLSVEQNIAFFAECSGLSQSAAQSAAERAMDTIGLSAMRCHVAATLSHGWKQRLKLAVALAHEPSILLLDEATAGMDPQTRHEMWMLMVSCARSGTTVLLATHHMDEASRCQRIISIAEGALHPDGLAARCT